MSIIRRRRRTRLVMPYNVFTRSTRAAFYKALEARLPITRACQLAGFSEATYYQWMDLGKDPRNLAHHFFRIKVLRIRARKEQEALKVIEDAGFGGGTYTETRIVIGGPHGRVLEKKKKKLKPSWEAAAWWLSKAYSRDYSPNMDNNSSDEERTPQEVAADIRDALREIEETVPDE